MNSDHSSPEEELRRREAELKEREIQIRMRELEAELTPPPVTPTRKHEEPSKPKKQPWYQRLPNPVKFILLAFIVIIALRVTTWIAAWLIYFVVVLGITGVVYKLFLESQD